MYARTTFLIRTAAAALLATSLAAGVSAAPALADDGDVTWTVRTATSSLGTDRSSFTYAVNPGGETRDALVVTNRGKTALDLGVYTADGFTTGTGQLDLDAKDKKGLGIGAWVHAAQPAVKVPAGKSVQVPFTVAVPANATPGDYMGGIVTSLTQPDETQGINVERRLGIRIKLRVGGDLRPALTAEDVHIGFAGTANPFAKGDATVTYTIHNTGNTIQSAQQVVSVAGPFGTFRAKAGQVAAPPQLLPGESWKVTVPVKGVAPALRLTATATLTPLITDASGSTTSMKPVVVTAHGWAVPWTLLIALLVLLALIAATVVLGRRNRVRRKQREDARVREAVEEALRTVS
nr:DUF916 domain-containing protein [uncultured Actinoplanes sp.]